MLHVWPFLPDVFILVVDGFCIRELAVPSGALRAVAHWAPVQNCQTGRLCATSACDSQPGIAASCKGVGK